MLTLHHLEYSQSFRILWLLEELGVEYELANYGRDPETHLAPVRYKALSPTGAAPVITEGEFTLAESSAIVDYILDRYPSETLRPAPGSPYRARYLFWLHAAQGSMMPVLILESVFRVIQTRVPFFLRPLMRAVFGKAREGFSKPRIDALLRQAEVDLATAPWFGGETLTAADIVLCYPMEAAKARGFLGAAHPLCEQWLERVHAYPSFQAAMEKDGNPSMVLPL